MEKWDLLVDKQDCVISGDVESPGGHHRTNHDIVTSDRTIGPASTGQQLVHIKGDQFSSAP